jgi:hypothetical protein
MWLKPRRNPAAPPPPTNPVLTIEIWQTGAREFEGRVAGTDVVIGPRLSKRHLIAGVAYEIDTALRAR